MKGNQPKRPIRRILIALDASTHSLAGLQAAAALAEKLQADLLGVFVEDINLLRLAELPFTQEVGQYSAHSRNLDTGQLERQFRAQADWARKALIKVAEASELPWSFRVVRGNIPAELISATQDSDLIILGQKGWSDYSRVGSTAQTVITQARKLTLIMRAGIQLGLSVLTIYDGSASASEALELAGDLAQADKGRLIVLLIAGDQTTARSLQEDVEAWAKSIDVIVQYRWLTAADAFLICSIAQTENSGVLVVPKEGSALSDETMMAILADINCPVMFVRQPESGGAAGSNE